MSNELRTLKFNVNGQTISQDPSCDFSGLFPGANLEVQAEFTFSPEWKNRAKVVAFWSILDKEYPPQVLNDENVCQIPEEVLKRPAFKIQILGKYRGRTFKTDKLTVYQRGGVR